MCIFFPQRRAASKVTALLYLQDPNEQGPHRKKLKAMPRNERDCHGADGRMMANTATPSVTITHNALQTVQRQEASGRKIAIHHDCSDRLTTPANKKQADDVLTGPCGGGPSSSGCMTSRKALRNASYSSKQSASARENCAIDACVAAASSQNIRYLPASGPSARHGVNDDGFRGRYLKPCCRRGMYVSTDNRGTFDCLHEAHTDIALQTIRHSTAMVTSL